MFSYTVNIYEKSGTFNVKVDSLVETFKIDESLDSAVLRIPRIARANAFARFSPVEVIVNDGNVEKTHWWLIYTPKSELSSYAPTPRYDHTLGLIEPTKWVDKFMLGSKTFTQPLGGTRYTLYAVVERIRLLTPFVPYASVSSTRLFTVDADLATYLDEIEAPQLYFDKKNLREALIEVLRYVNAIPRLEYVDGVWVLNADFINQRHLPFDIESGIIDYNNEATGEDYAQKVEVFHENTIAQEDEITTGVYSNSITDVLTASADDYILGDSTFKIILTNKVYKMLSVKAKTFTKEGYLRTVDITSYIVEKKIYDTYEFDDNPPAKKYAGYWSYGLNVIDGLNATYNALFANIALYFILTDALDDQFSESLHSSWTFAETSFYVEYIPYIEQMRSEQYREDTDPYGNQANMLDRYATLQINPQERINSLFQLTKNAYGQIQRLGVDTVAISRRHRALTTYSGENDGIYSLGDYTDDGYFITKKEVVYFNSFVIARYEMSRNFNRIAQFVNIDKEFRPYEISLSKSDRTLRRSIIFTPFVVEIGTSNSHTTNSLVEPFMNTLKNVTYTVPVSQCLFERSQTGTDYTNDAVIMPLVLSSEKNVIKYKIDFNDTKVAGKRTRSGSVNNLQLFQVPYTFSDGTFNYIKMTLYNGYWDYSIETNALSAAEAARKVARVGWISPFVDTSKNVVISTSSLDSSLIFAYIFDTVSNFPIVGKSNAYYVALSGSNSYHVFQYLVGDGYVDLNSEFTLICAYKPDGNEVYELPEYLVFKDGAEVISSEIAIPILPHKDKVNTFVIGDWLVQDNALIKPRSSEKTLYYWTSSRFFDKAETKNISFMATRSEITVSADVGVHSISVDTSIVETDLNYAIADIDGNLYLAVNQINFDGTITTVPDIYFNFRPERS